MRTYLHRFLGLTLLFLSNQVRSNEDEAAYIFDVAGSYSAYPPIDPDPSIWEDGSITPVDVYVLQTVLAIDSISPGTSEFTATTRTTYYYTPEHCNQTVAQQYACDTTLSNGNGLKFFASSLAKSLPERRLFLSQENVHATKFEKDGKNLTLNAEQVETRGTYFKNYDMRYFPWEIHVLEIPLTSLYTSNIVNVVQFPGNVESYGSPVVPNGWAYIATYCDMNTDSEKKAIASKPLSFSTYTCVVAVARKNSGWWWTSFTLFAALIFMAYAGSVGLTSHMVAECRDDRDSARRALFDGTRLVGTYTIGLLLTYVFQVQISPYNNSIEYWPRFPTSSMIYVLGLIGIIFQSFAGLTGSVIFSRPLNGEGFYGGLLGAYNLEKVPKEGKVGEERAPLLLNQYNPDAKKVVSEETGEEKTEGVIDPSIARVRMNTQKTYIVLSVEEAVYVNKFVKRLFWFKTGLFIAIIVCALTILVCARVGFENEIKQVYAFLESVGVSSSGGK